MEKLIEQRVRAIIENSAPLRECRRKQALRVGLLCGLGAMLVALTAAHLYVYLAHV